MLLLESVINRYLALDPEMLDKMAAFDGKVIKLEISPVLDGVVERELFLFPGRQGLHVSTTYDGEVDTVLRGSPVALFKMGLAADSAELLLKGEVEISGDTRLGHRFKSVFAQMAIDWAEPLAALLGDSVAFQLQQSGQRFARWGQDTLQSFTANVSEYLQEESRDVVTEAELEVFYHAVDQLRDDVERLQAKINLLQKTSST